MKGGEPIFIDKKSKVGLLMIHGFTSTPYQFKDAAEFFSLHGYTVYAPLIAGHGTKPEDLMNTTTEQWKDSIKKSYVQLKEKVEKVIVIGNSFGGNLAIYLIKELNNEPLGFVSLGTPIYLKYQLFIKLRYYTYAWMKKYHRKSKRIYRTDYTDLIDEITYSLIPMKSLKRFLGFLKETKRDVKAIKIPSFVMHANKDCVVNSKSALYIYEHLASQHKMIYFYASNNHVVATEQERNDLFERVLRFVNELSNGKNNSTAIS